MTAAIIIVNYRTPDLTIDCLRSLAGEMEPGRKAIITDNASGDDSVGKISAAIEANGWANWAKLVPLPKNGGFAYGNNRGIEAAGEADYVLLINSDTRAFPGVMRHCIDVMEKDAKIGLMSCLLENPDGSVQNAARRFPTPLRLASNNLGLTQKWPGVFGGADIEDPGWDRRTTRRDVDWVGGAFMFIRGSMLKKIGGLDERFFFYGEDIEFSHRVWKKGWRVRYDPGAKITHIGGASSDPTRVAAKLRNVMMWKARYQLQRRLYGWPAVIFVRWVDIMAVALRSLKLALTGRRGTPEYRVQRDVLSLLLRPLRG